MGRRTVAVLLALSVLTGGALAQQVGAVHPVVAPNQQTAINTFAAALAASAPTIVTTPTHGGAVLSGGQFAIVRPAPAAPSLEPAPVAPYAPPLQATAIAQVAEPAPIVSGPAPDYESASESKRFSVDFAAGVGILSYAEMVSSLGAAADSDFDQGVAVVKVLGRGRITDNFFGALAWQGSFTLEGTETWPGIGTVAGLPITQTNDLSVDQHLVDAYVGYTWRPWSSLSLEPIVGWHYLRQSFDRSNFAFTVGGIVFPVALAPVSEDFNGHGPLIGLDASYADLPFGLTASAGVQFVYVLDLDVDNSLVGSINGADGHSWRWKVALTRQFGLFDLGLRYSGQHQLINGKTTAIAILPENETQVHALLVSAGIPF